jgi:hypothetical protein
MEVWILFGTFVFLLLIGTPVAFCLGVSSFATVLYLGLPPVVVFQRLNSGVSVFALMAIPFFIFAGELMVRGDIARRLVALAAAMVGHMRGGLGQVNITASVLFGGISGSAAADATAIGGLMIPQMKEKGYSVEYGVNVTVISSIIALMLPPSHNMIIYSISAGGRLSIADLFTAGIIPGLFARCIIDDHRLVCCQEGRLSDRVVSRLGHAGGDIRQCHSGHPADRHYLRRRSLGYLHRFRELVHRRRLCVAGHYAGLSHHELGQLCGGHQSGRSHHRHGAAGDRLRGLFRLAACVPSNTRRAGVDDEGGLRQSDHYSADDQPGPADARHLHGYVATDRHHHTDLPPGRRRLRRRSSAFRCDPGAQSGHRSLYPAGGYRAVRWLRGRTDLRLGCYQDDMAFLRGRRLHTAVGDLHSCAVALAAFAFPLRLKP